MKFVRHFLAISAMYLLQGVQAEAQQPAELLPETKVVMRISREFIHELTGKQFKRDEPIDKNALGAEVKGSAHVDGKFDVKLQKSDNASDFDLLVSGEVLTQVVATSRPVQIFAHGVGAFTGRRHIGFDGDAFTGHVMEMNVTYHSTIDQLRSSQGGLIGAVTRGIAGSSARRNLPEADRQAEDEIRTQLTTAIERDTDHLILTMNKVGPLLKKGEQLLRDEKVLSARSVQHYLAATDKHLYMSIGPPGRRIPKLPTIDVSKRRPIELWIAISKGSKKDLFNPILEHWKDVKPFVLQRLAVGSPDLVKIVENVEVESVDGWHVLTFAPKLLDLP